MHRCISVDVTCLDGVSAVSKPSGWVLSVRVLTGIVGYVTDIRPSQCGYKRAATVMLARGWAMLNRVSTRYWGVSLCRTRGSFLFLRIVCASSLPTPPSPSTLQADSIPHFRTLLLLSPEPAYSADIPSSSSSFETTKEKKRTMAPERY